MEREPEWWTVARNLPHATVKEFSLASSAFTEALQMARRYAEAVITEPDGTTYVLRWLDT